MHPVRKLKDLSEGRKAGYQPSLWQLMTIARRRKTLILCLDCYDKLHAGTLPDLRQVTRGVCSPDSLAPESSSSLSISISQQWRAVCIERCTYGSEGG